MSDNRNNALEAAAAVDKKIAAGEAIADMAGVPGAIKDVICIAGQNTTCGSKILEHFKSPYNATVIEKLNALDYISLGKTNMDEFAMGSSTENSAYQITHNPWNLDYVPGGSSGGSAAAVAAGEAVWSLGSDTGGSIRQPAAYCGLVGLKPTYGLVSRYGLVAYGSSLDQIGPFTNDVEDCATVLNAIAGHDAKDSTSIPQEKKDYKKALVNDVKGMKIGVPEEFFVEGLDDQCRKALEEAIDTYKKLGAEIVPCQNASYEIWPGCLLHHCSGRSQLQSGTVTTELDFGFRADGTDIVDMYRKDPYRRVWTRSKTAHYAGDVCLKFRLLRCLLSAGYESAYPGKTGF